MGNEHSLWFFVLGAVMSDNDSWTITDIVGVGAFLVAAAGVLALIGFGLYSLITHGEMVKRVQPVCDYLHAERQGNLCVKNGQVVYDDDKR